MPRYIDANALKIRVLANSKPRNHADNEDGAFDRGYNAGIFAASKVIDSAPTLSPDEVRGVGEWIRVSGFHLDHEYYPARYQCDQCKHFVDSGDDRNYCPNCGARMKGVSEDD